MGAPRTVLVVDPNPNTLERVSRALTDSDLEILHARDASEAEDTAKGRNLVLVLASATLPNGNGYDLADALRRSHPTAVVFLMAGGFEVFDSKRAAETGVVGRIPKPFSTDTLLFHVTSAVGSLDNLGNDDELPALDGDDIAPVEVEVEDELEEEEEQKEVDGHSSAPEPLTAPDPIPEPDELPSYAGDMEPVSAAPVIRKRRPETPKRPLGVPESHYRPPKGSERVATFLPRDYEQLPRVSVDPEVIGPAMEQAILEVLPEVVEVVLRNALATSESFQHMLELAVKEEVERQLPEIVRRNLEESSG